MPLTLQAYFLELLSQQYDYKSAPFHIITPLRSEDTLTIANPRWPLLDTSHAYSLFEALKITTASFEGSITPIIIKIVEQIDTLKMPENSTQGITLIPSDSNIAHVV